MTFATVYRHIVKSFKACCAFRLVRLNIKAKNTYYKYHNWKRFSPKKSTEQKVHSQDHHHYFYLHQFFLSHSLLLLLLLIMMMVKPILDFMFFLFPDNMFSFSKHVIMVMKVTKSFLWFLKFNACEFFELRQLFIKPYFFSISYH